MLKFRENGEWLGVHTRLPFSQQILAVCQALAKVVGTETNKTGAVWLHGACSPVAKTDMHQITQRNIGLQTVLNSLKGKDNENL